MKTTLIYAGISSLCIALLSACAGTSMTKQDTASNTSIATVSAAIPAAPAALRTADNERVAFVWQAIGSQVYECRSATGADASKGAMAWAFVAPEAELLGDKGTKVGTHGAGPHWTALDGSTIVGTVKARANGESANDIPLLLLSAKSTAGPGKMASVTSVQRLNTQGGNAQPAGCTTAQDAGKRSKQGYTADYVFYTAK
jgi:hypothetical protein